MKKTFSIGGVHPDDKKISAGCAIEVLPTPKTVYISMAQHLGGPAKAIVAAGDKVKTGQVIGEPTGFISAYVHSSVTGTVKSVGLGGATVPTNVKLCPPPDKKADILILNGAECEPYLTSDYRIMIEKPQQIIIGAALMKRVLGVSHVVVGIEENKPEAIAKMKEAIASLAAGSSDYSGIEVVTLKKKYPQGGEKQLIDAITRRQVKSMGLPIDVGAVVQNVATSLAVYEAVQKNKPLIDNTITVTGECFPKQSNLLVRVGTPLSYIIDSLGGVPESAAKAISGGPMMGKAIANLDAATLKGTSSILFLTDEQTRRKPETNCIRCGKCAEACPMGLEPFLLNKLARNGMMDELEQNAVQDCIECGCCLYSCPANIPLLDTIRIAKGEVIRIIRSRSAQKK